MNISTPAQKKLSKENLKQLISSKNVSITLWKENEKDHASKVWKNISTITVQNIKQDYVMMLAHFDVSPLLFIPNIPCRSPFRTPVFLQKLSLLR